MNGLLLVDKPAGFTSHDVVGKVRRIFNQKTVGHTGTLDPLATGLMVLVLGEATKLSDFLTFADKSYRLTAQLGVRTDSFDATGKVLSEVAVDVSEADIRKNVLALSGPFDWPVPVFSATKVNGKKLYELGRKEIEVELPVKRMEFFDLEIHSVEPTTVTVSMRCTKGSFVRTWCSQLGDRLGVGAHLSALRRTTVGPYRLEQALTLEQMAENPDLAKAAIIPMAETLPGWRSICIPGKEERLLLNGQIPRDLANRLIVEQKEAFRTNQPIGVKVVTTNGDLISILVAQPGNGLKIRRVFRLDPSSISQ